MRSRVASSETLHKLTSTVRAPRARKARQAIVPSASLRSPRRLTGTQHDEVGDESEPRIIENLADREQPIAQRIRRQATKESRARASDAIANPCVAR